MSRKIPEDCGRADKLAFRAGRYFAADYLVCVFLVCVSIVLAPGSIVWSQTPDVQSGSRIRMNTASTTNPATSNPAKLNVAEQPLQLIVLGIAQDAGFPQAGCDKPCCGAAWKDHRLRRMVSSIAIIDRQTGLRFLFDCTPDFPDQLKLLDNLAPTNSGSASKPNSAAKPKSAKLNGVFLTHAHIGHYSGLIHLGREVMGTAAVPVHVMPRMGEFLRTNGPWSQLVKIGNIELNSLAAEEPKKIGRMIVTPFLVPHRDEFSETVGFRIQGPNKSVAFLPDIDKWSNWDDSIEDLLREVDVAYIDGTFFENGEIPGRDMALIPHPFVSETINRFAPLDEVQRKKVRFIVTVHGVPIDHNILWSNRKQAQQQSRMQNLRFASTHFLLCLLALLNHNFSKPVNGYDLFTSTTPIQLCSQTARPGKSKERE